MAAAAELTLLEKSLGLSKGNKYSAQGERPVRRGGGAERERGRGARPGRAGPGGGGCGARMLPGFSRVCAPSLLRPWLPEGVKGAGGNCSARSELSLLPNCHHRALGKRGGPQRALR